MILFRSLMTSLLVSVMAAGSALGAEPAHKLAPGSTLTVQFPEMPPTFCAVHQKKDIKAQMTIFLPANYDPGRKFPLLIFLNGGDGGTGRELGVARSLSEGKDFVCVSMPLFIKDLKENGGIIQDEDGQYMWPCFRTMLDKLLQVVPNIDTEHMSMGGFSNGSHAVQGLINESDGAIARRFSAFFVIEGGPRPQRWYLLKGKPYLIVISQGRALDGMKLYCDTAKDAGVNATLICEDIGSHGIPEKAYPAMRAWLIGPAMGKAPAAPAEAPAPASTKKSVGAPTAGQAPAAEEGAAPKQSAGNDIAGKVAATDTLKTRAELMKSADISEQLSGEGPMTFFAPTDAAFAAMPKDQLDALKKDPKAARELLLNLMVKKDISPMNLPLAGKMKTLGGGILTASPVKAAESDTGPLGLAMVNDAKVLKRIPVSKGRRIYSLDKVVFAEKPAASEQSTATDKPAAEPDTAFTLTFPDLPPTFDELGNPRQDHAMLMRMGGVPLVKGKCYQITFRIRSSELRQPVGVDVQDTNGWKHSGLNKAIRPGTDWTQGEFYFKNQNNMGDTARLDFSFLQTGHMDVADVKIVEIAAVPADRNAPAQVVDPTNLVTNGDFSDVTNGVPTGWGTAGNKNDVDQVLTAEKDADGKPFARVTCTRLEHHGPGNKPMITVYLPKNYDTRHKFPLLVFLQGGTGGIGDQISTPRALAQDKDFICVNMPLFKEAEAVKNQRYLFIDDPDAKFAWSVYKKMLARLDETVPNIDPAHRIIGGFSNGGHTTKGIINQSEGEATTYFTAFYLVEGGAGLDRFDLLKGKPLLILYGAKNGGAWADRLCKAAIDAGVKAEVYGMPNTGHDFPAFVYPRFRAWLRGPALE